MKNKILTLVLGIGLSLFGTAQLEKRAELKNQSVFQKKFLYGFAVNNSWANYRDCKDSSFYRPSLGIHARGEYNFTEYLHLSLGFGLQQRGMGIYTLDLDKSIGDPDSTGRLRYKSSTVDFPIEIAFRPEKEVFKNSRLHFGLGVTPSFMYRAQRIWKSVDDGFHVPQVITPQFKRFDFPLRASLGLDVDAPGNVLFRVQAVFEYGFSNIYTHPLTGTTSFKNTLFGLDLTFLF